MAVVDNQHATQIVLENGKSMVFDDVGCMYEWLAANANEQLPLNLSVIIMIKNGYWLMMPLLSTINPVKTPMAYNVISFKDEASAEEFSAENEKSTFMTANELAQHGWVQNHDMMQKHRMENHSHSETADTDHSDMSQ